MSCKPSFVIISGLSGSGKSTVLKTFEDLNYDCSDNLPVDLLPHLIHTRSQGQEHSPRRIAIGIDVRCGNALASPHQLRQLVNDCGVAATLLFFDADDQTLLKRYSETRRRHPLSHLGLSLPQAIAREREITNPIRTIADAVIDTTSLNVHQLRRYVTTEFALAQTDRLSLLFESFAYKRGIPVEADFIFDARVLPNPHWNINLRPLTGRDHAVRTFLDQQADVALYRQQIAQFLDTWLPKLQNDTRSYVTIAFGCTGGKHRSVYLAEQFAQHARQQGWHETATFHRELD